MTFKTFKNEYFISNDMPSFDVDETTESTLEETEDYFDKGLSKLVYLLESYSLINNMFNCITVNDVLEKRNYRVKILYTTKVKYVDDLTLSILRIFPDLKYNNVYNNITYKLNTYWIL